MSETTTAVNTNQSAAADTVVVTTTPTEGDAEARIAQLETEKAKLIEENANYKLGMLKAKGKVIEDLGNETDDERTRRIIQEELSQTKIAAIDKEKEELLVKLAKENKELKLAQLNKNDAPAATLGTHSETKGVQDTLVTPDQMAAFKARGWSDKDIERYKKNLNRYGK